MIHRLIRWLAFRYNQTCYQAGYNDGYGQGHFDGYAYIAFGLDEEMPAPGEPPVSHGSDQDQDIPF